MRLPAGILEHKIITQLAGVLGPDGETPATPTPDVAAHVEESSKLKVDQRSTSSTAGVEIVASTRVLTQIEDYVPPGSFITTELNGKQQVFNAARYQHSRAPEHAEMWLT